MNTTHCSQCGYEAAIDALLCGQCGATLEAHSCGVCGAVAIDGARFCFSCGAPLIGTQAKTNPQLDFFHSPLQVEQRQATVINCDLVDFTSLTASLDPEDSRRVLAEALDAIRRVVYRFKNRDDDHFDRTEGDSVMFCFGLPRASERDAEQAVRAALEAVEAVKRIRPLPWLVVNVRIGVATGQVVVDANTGKPERGEPLISGPAPNLAGRLRACAQPGAVVISDATHRLVYDAFKCSDLGELALKGLDPERAWEVSSTRHTTNDHWPHGSRLTATPLIGREQEVGVFLHRWDMARAGGGQCIVIAGEAGMGKSRLVSELQARLKKQKASFHYLKCGQQYANSAFHPISEFLQKQVAKIVSVRGLSPLKRVAKYIEVCGLPAADLPYIADVVFGAGLPQSYGSATLSDQSRIDLQLHRRETIRSLLDLIQLTIARQGASVIAFEDAHWSDPSSIEVMEAVTKRIAEWPCLLLITLRPEESASRWSRDGVTYLELNRLSRSESAKLVRSVPNGQTLSHSALTHIVEKADGVPFFIEELTKEMVDATDGTEVIEQLEIDMGVSPVPVPVTLRDLLTARLDRSHRAKFVAQVGSIIGREFSTPDIASVGQVSGIDIERGLTDLREAGLLFTQDTPRGLIHTFKHALVQDVACDSMMRSDKRQFHERFARVLENRSEGARDRQPEIVAYHYYEARNYEKALRYFTEGGEIAASRSANREAMHQFKRALEALKLCTPSAKRNQIELRLHAAIGQVLAITQGYASDEVAHAFEQARRLFPVVQESAAKFSVLWREGDMFLFRAQYDLGLQRGKELAQAAIENGNSEYLAYANLLIGLAQIYLGQFELAKERLQKALDIDSIEEPPAHTAARPGELPIRALGYLSRPLWFLGFPDTALKHCRAAIALAEHTNIPLSTTQAYGMRMMLHAACRDDQQLKVWIDTTLAAGNEHNQVYWIRLATILDCWRRARDGGGESAIRGLEIGITNYEATGSRVGLSAFLMLWADALSYVDRYEASFKLLDRAIAFAKETREEYFLSELHRVRGDVILRFSRDRAIEDAEQAYRMALDVARRQTALTLELRAAVELAKLWRSKKRLDDADALLRPIYDRFREGFESVDLVQAKCLLDEFSAERVTQPAQ